MEKMSDLEFDKIFNEHQEEIRESLKAVFLDESLTASAFDLADSPITKMLLYVKGISIVALNIMIYGSVSSDVEVSREEFVEFLYLNNSNLNKASTILTEQIIEDRTLEIFKKHGVNFDTEVVCKAREDEQ